MKKSNLFFKNGMTTLSFLLLILLLPNASLNAQSFIPYHIEVRTKNVTRGGTDNNVHLRLIGEDGKQTSSFQVKGTKERNELTSWTVQLEDIGKIKQLKINSEKALLDEWACLYVFVTRNSNTPVHNHPQGYYQFRPNKFVGYSAKKYDPVHARDPDPMVIIVGSQEMHPNILTIVNFGDNSAGSADQTMMKFTETFQTIESVAVSDENMTSATYSVTASYTPPSESGGFGGSVTGSWGSEVSKIKTRSDEYLNQSTFDWSYLVSKNRCVFRKVLFNVPYGYQILQDDQGESRAVRSLGGLIVPIGNSAFLDIPRMDEDDNIIPVSWEEIEASWLLHASPEIVRDVKLKKEDWLSKGWITTSDVSKMSLSVFIDRSIAYSDTSKGVTIKVYHNKTGSPWIQSYTHSNSEAEKSFDIAGSNRPNFKIEKIEISASGDDAYLIDYLTIKQDGNLLKQWGADGEGEGFCFSTDSKDGAGWVTQDGCKGSYNFPWTGDMELTGLPKQKLSIFIDETIKNSGTNNGLTIKVYHNLAGSPWTQAYNHSNYIIEKSFDIAGSNRANFKVDKIEISTSGSDAYLIDYLSLSTSGTLERKWGTKKDGKGYCFSTDSKDGRGWATEMTLGSTGCKTTHYFFYSFF